MPLLIKSYCCCHCCYIPCPPSRRLLARTSPYDAGECVMWCR
uniref:4Fe-4S ferredoxin-type domain-containing protein n=1 Tax=Echinococcus granulosus TaxID=6210 RepID=U6FQQ5_ECHGR|nr:unnamed protein product [Echinococcus granulosus]